MHDEEALNKIIEERKVKLPKHWDEFTWEQKVDWVTHRILVDTRGTTKHSEMKEQGWLSNYQLERRRRREVLSKYGSWDEIPPKKGTFGRSYNPESKEE
jgi:hypothetical protein